MTVIFSFLLILYTLFIILAVISLLYATPMMMDRVSWLKDKSGDEKVLIALSVHLIIIILAVTSVWNFQQWKTDYRVQKYYEQLRSGNAPIPNRYSDFLVGQYPDLGKEYRRIASEVFVIEERMLGMKRFKKSLMNQEQFIDNITGRWSMILDRLKVIKTSIEIESLANNQSIEVMNQIHNKLTKDIRQTYAEIVQSRRNIEILMSQYAAKSTRFLQEPVLDDPGYPIESLKEKNYYRVIGFFVSEYGELAEPLGLIAEKIRDSKTIIRGLHYEIKTKNMDMSGAIDDVLFEWEYTSEYAHLRLLKVLHAIETEYVLREMGMTPQHPAMKKLKQEIPPMLKYYSETVYNRWIETKQNSNPQLVLASH